MPAGYDPVRAYTLCVLTEIAQKRARGERPELPVPYLVAADLGNRGTIFVSPGDVVVAFAGSVERGTAMVSLAELRSALVEKLARLHRAMFPLFLAGHGDGGSLATVAALDLHTAPEADCPRVAGVYTYDAASAENELESGVADISFHLLLSDDHAPMPRLRSRTIRLSDAASTAQRDVAAYCALLDPTGGADYAVGDPSPDALAHHAAGLAERGLSWENDVQKCTLDTIETGGRMIVSWDRVQSFPDPAKYDEHSVHIAVTRIIVRAGHELVIDAPHQQHVHLVATELILGPEARVTIRTEARLHLGRLIALPPSNGALHIAPPAIEVRGGDGTCGARGAHGSSGVDGVTSRAGSTGGDGGSGGAGQSGTSAPPVMIFVDELCGHFTVRTEGGAGGDGGGGGTGGRGGHGGALSRGELALGGDGGRGGSGGEGGAAGHGGVVHLVYRTASDDMHVDAHTPSAGGGRGGDGGAGGHAGYGHPSGCEGARGGAGSTGAPGHSGNIICMRRGHRSP